MVNLALFSNEIHLEEGEHEREPPTSCAHSPALDFHDTPALYLETLQVNVFETTKVLRFLSSFTLLMF